MKATASLKGRCPHWGHNIHFSDMIKSWRIKKYEEEPAYFLRKTVCSSLNFNFTTPIQHPCRVAISLLKAFGFSEILRVSSCEVDSLTSLWKPKSPEWGCEMSFFAWQMKNVHVSNSWPQLTTDEFCWVYWNCQSAVWECSSNAMLRCFLRRKKPDEVVWTSN